MAYLHHWANNPSVMWSNVVLSFFPCTLDMLKMIFDTFNPTHKRDPRSQQMEFNEMEESAMQLFSRDLINLSVN